MCCKRHKATVEQIEEVNHILHAWFKSQPEVSGF